MGPSSITFTVPIKTRSGDNAREHHFARARRVATERDATAWSFRAARDGRGGYEGWDGQRVPALPVVVTMTRLSSGRLDSDGLRSACKGIRDQIAVEIGLPIRKMAKGQTRPVADDRDPRVEWRYAQEKSARGVYGVRVVIEPKEAAQ